MVEFAGWYMPVQYKGVKEEHLAVRKNVGLFDVSHMGEIFVRGDKALETLQWVTSNNVAKLEEGQAQYTLLTNEEGGIVDDVIVYCLQKDAEYMVCANAANVKKDFDWIVSHTKGADITDESESWAQLAVQGPKALELVDRVLKVQSKGLKPFALLWADFGGARSLVARTGYTGEEGVEVFVPAEGAVALWREFVEEGKAYGLEPVGLGARDTLRLEMKYSLYGHEIDDTTNPIEAGLSWVVRLKKGDFVGRDVIERVKTEGPQKACIGFKMADKGIPRQGYLLKSFDNQEIGRVTSGTMSPSLGEAIGIGYVEKNFAEVGKEIMVDIRGRSAKAVVVETPFVK
jgi:aminomethyltransferase